MAKCGQSSYRSDRQTAKLTTCRQIAHYLEHDSSDGKQFGDDHFVYSDIPIRWLQVASASLPFAAQLEAKAASYYESVYRGSQHDDTLCPICDDRVGGNFDVHMQKWRCVIVFQTI